VDVLDRLEAAAGTNPVLRVLGGQGAALHGKRHSVARYCVGDDVPSGLEILDVELLTRMNAAAPILIGYDGSTRRVGLSTKPPSSSAPAEHCW
jgi:hypothetical protein